MKKVTIPKYTLGEEIMNAITHGIGSKKKYMHSAFHIFVLVASILQFFSIFLYVI